ncbi:glucagon receptor isoform X4 [Takifugu flavidus]|uniref:glucagon receptor isoform X4 n=1 Tax=Takifugu flavidus TaxID=433684 RepID=UPI002544ACF8|nr:glucagon receptor isoform X4 [Takifugu flavidus]
MSQVCLLLVLLILCSYTKFSSANSLELVKEQWSSYKNQCLDYLSSAEPSTGLVCNRTFDLYACWPDGLPGTTVNVSCPWFLPWYRKGLFRHSLVYRFCSADGEWAPKNTSECEDDPAEQHYGLILGQLRIMYTVGYSLSLGALLLALGILIAFRKLHCMRNNIHMNLFASFILRAVSILVKDAFLTLTLDSRSSNNTQAQAPVNTTGITWCRGAMVMMQYSVMANNYWLLVEGIYLHSLLVITVFSEKKYFYIYMAIGWGAPLMFVVPWITVKYLYENEECWERNINMGFWWIIRSPILFAYLINFFIFIRIIKILMSKLRAHQMRYTDYKFSEIHPDPHPSARDSRRPLHLRHRRVGPKRIVAATHSPLLRPAVQLFPGAVGDAEKVEEVEAGQRHRRGVPPHLQPNSAPQEWQHCHGQPAPP